jgi:hypothetical protein
MIFDVMLLLKEKSTSGKERRNAYRVHDRDLSRFVRDAQDRGDYIEQVHPLFRQKRQEGGPIDTSRETLDDVIKFNREIFSRAGLSAEKLQEVNMSHIVDPIDPNAMIDSHGF